MKKSVVEKEIRHEQCKETLEKEKTFPHGMDFLQSEGHEIYGVCVNKISLCPFDSKRYISENGIHTYAYGYQLTDDELEDALLELFMD